LRVYETTNDKINATPTFDLKYRVYGQKKLFWIDEIAESIYQIRKILRVRVA
jgi:hypothetical protein